jgi:hypothetical protein
VLSGYSWQHACFSVCVLDIASSVSERHRLYLFFVVEHSVVLALAIHHVDEKLMAFKCILLDSDAIEAFHRGDHQP